MSVWHLVKQPLALASTYAKTLKRWTSIAVQQHVPKPDSFKSTSLSAAMTRILTLGVI
jgi:hypothetical protein